VQREISRHRGFLPDPALKEYKQALRVYTRLAERAR
jgi:hypothetical protein